MSTIAPVAFLTESLSGGEILIVFLAALLLFGAKNLPHMARTLGRTLEQFRRAAREMSDEILNADEQDKNVAPRRGTSTGDPRAHDMTPPGEGARSPSRLPEAAGPAEPPAATAPHPTPDQDETNDARPGA